MFGAIYFGQMYFAGALSPDSGVCSIPGFGTLYFAQYPTCFGGVVPPVPPIPPVPPTPADSGGGFSDTRQYRRRFEIENDRLKAETEEEMEIVRVLAEFLGNQ